MYTCTRTHTLKHISQREKRFNNINTCSLRLRKSTHKTWKIGCGSCMPKMLSHCYLCFHTQEYQYNMTTTMKTTATAATTMLFVMKPEQRNSNVCCIYIYVHKQNICTFDKQKSEYTFCLCIINNWQFSRHTKLLPLLQPSSF